MKSAQFFTLSMLVLLLSVNPDEIKGQTFKTGPQDFGRPGFVPPQTDLEVTRFYPELKPVDYIVAVPYARGTFQLNWEIPVSEKAAINASGVVKIK